MLKLCTPLKTAVFLLSAVGSGQGQREPEQTEAVLSQDAIVGLWATEPNEGEWSQVEVYRCQDRYCGRIVWLSHPLIEDAGDGGAVGDPKTDWKNGDEDLRARPLLGLELMHSFRFDDEKWKDGRIYDPENGKTYRCELTLAEGGHLLKVRGYVRIAFVNIGRTTEWTRVPAEVMRGR